ncbi:hypothetical protein [Streptomyces hydrogenans]
MIELSFSWSTVPVWMMSARSAVRIWVTDDFPAFVDLWCPRPPCMT